MTNKTVPLESPLSLGDRKIAEIILRKPAAGDLRGVSMLMVQRWDADECLKIAGRINLSQLAVAEFEQLEPYDLSAVITEVASFFISPKAMRAAGSETATKAPSSKQ